MNFPPNGEKTAALKKKANMLPCLPGVYIMKDKNGSIIYIGKAKALKNRVTQYFGSGVNHTEKVRKMVSLVDDFDYIICDSEFEALILENSLIKQNQPKYNILLKDDKGYHYIKITGEKWKKITTSMQTDDKAAQYIGPYYSGYVVKDTVDEVRKIFKLPDCNRSFDKPSKPCLNFHIGLCDAPCKAKISYKEYIENVDSAIDFIKQGSYQGILPILSKRMNEAADRLDFEYAAKLRDRINAIKKLSEQQKVYMSKYKAQDVFAAAQIGEQMCVGVMVFKDNRLSDKNQFFIDGFSNKTDMYLEFLQQYYSDKREIPPRILLDVELQGKELIERWLCEKAGRRVSIVTAYKGEQRALVDMCANNAAEALSKNVTRESRESAVLSELAAVLALGSPPKRIEAYDISHTAGDENVAGMVVYVDGKPHKAHYRKFKIKGFGGQDDYQSMAEVLERRFCEYEKREDESFSKLPDLILLDGAKGQISAVLPVIKRHNIEVAVFGMVKDSKHKTRAIATTGGDIVIKSNRNVFTFITRVQDEVHRFAIGYHQKRRSNKMLSSALTEIEGIGESRAAALLKAFKSIKAIREASVEELRAVKGMNLAAAQKVYEYYKDEN